jgi:hypothetical protein
MLLKKLCTDCIQLTRRHARFCCVEHFLENKGDDSPDAFECDDVVLSFDGHEGLDVNEQPKSEY